MGNTRFADRGAADRDKPVFICTHDSELGAAMAFDLRHYGFKARTFVNARVMANAADSAPPGTIVLDTAVLDDQAIVDTTLPRLRELAPLLFLSDRDDFDTRLKAARAGGCAFVTTPISFMTLIHELQRTHSQGESPHPRVAVITQADSPLAELAASVRARGMTCLLHEPREIAEQLAAKESQIVLLDADLDGYEPKALLRVVRQLPGYSVVPILLCTTGDKRRLDGLVAAESADGTLGVPISPEDLHAIITARVQRAETVRDAYRFIARRDPLSGLQNTDYFVEGLSHGLATGAFEHTHAGIAVVELANTTTDVEMRSRVVRTADILRRRLPPFATAARMDDTTLAAAFTVSSERELARVASRLQSALAETGTDTDGHPQVGVAVLDGTVTTVEHALQTAREAINAETNHTESAGREHGEDEHHIGDFWSRRVGEALRGDRFRLVYQPISNLNGHPSSLYEVFVRMLDADNSDILPREFLPSVQRSGLSADLDRWIIGRAIHVLGEHAGRQDQPRLFVKVFPESLADDNLGSWIVDQARIAALSPDRLVFEIPLDATITRTQQALTFVNTLKDAGFAIALENYAPGDETAGLLERLSPDYVKLAPGLTETVATDPKAQTTLTEATAHARELGIPTIAAQVQDALLVSMLWQTGVEFIQGYFMQEPADVFAPETQISH